jgi:hypothetical protein
MGVFLLLIVGLSLSSGLVQEEPGMMGQVVLGLLAFGLVLFSISFWLSKRLNKEKIVISIPD